MVKNEIKNYGFEEPCITADNHILGGLGTVKKLLNPDLDWTPFLPKGERQKRLIETYTCTEYGTEEAIETLEKRLFLKDENHSERLVAIGSKNKPTGNDPHIVAEWIRKNGLVNEEVLPFDDTITSWSQYFSPNPLTQKLKDKAKEWLTEYTFNHEWVFKGGSLKEKQKKLLEALQYSPVCVSVHAWKKRGGVYVKDRGDRDTHWTLLVKGNEGKPWIIRDSYLDDGNFMKKLDWNYPFGFAKLYILNKKPQSKPSCFLWKLFYKWV
ncbi:MAG TPA: hypothetical protein ENI23_16985 [bacterium]|nr:hypothetical protein [bacterium]